MKTFICEICGDAYLGEEKPKNCPFCGARDAFIKEGKDAKPVVNVKENLSDVSKKNLEETLQLEMRANAIYTCMTGKAINYEIERQSELLEKGDKIVQETRGWDSVKNITVSQRKKESAHDYRYFPEPDIPPMEFTEQYVKNLKCKLPELPDAKEKRFVLEYGLNEADVLVLTAQNDLAEYFENVVSEIKEKIKSHEIESSEEKTIKLATNYIISELRKHLAENNHNVRDLKISAENYAELIGLIADGKINSSAAQTVLKEMYHTGGDPSQIIEEKNLGQMQDSSKIETAVESVIAANAKSVEDYKAGKQNALQFLMGQVMKETQGKANPMKVIEILKSKLN